MESRETAPDLIVRARELAAHVWEPRSFLVTLTLHAPVVDVDPAYWSSAGQR